jgi:hypothetical protein
LAALELESCCLYTMSSVTFFRRVADLSMKDRAALPGLLIAGPKPGSQPKPRAAQAEPDPRHRLLKVRKIGYVIPLADVRRITERGSRHKLAPLPYACAKLASSDITTSNLLGLSNGWATNLAAHALLPVSATSPNTKPLAGKIGACERESRENILIYVGLAGHS